MYNTNEKKDHFNKEILPHITNLEKNRKEFTSKNYFKTSIILFLGPIIILFLSIIGLIENINFELFIPLFFIFIFIASLYLAKHRLKYNQYNKDFKELVITKIIKFYDENAIYDHGGEISKTQFDKASLILNKYDDYNGEDYIEMNVSNNQKDSSTKIYFSEILVTDTYKDKDGNTHTRNIFKGLFI